ncbi:MAG: hypothetical protein JSV12_08455 [Candidatus Bathyarchaeota archaeon]|nr:MAG: hypothetical protein JSV12_08455 [Candidatus Bathyarchaeota archaeon]
MSKKKKERPRIELLQSTSMYTVELCNPIKEKINQIKICRPNIVVKLCNPIEDIKCLPDIKCFPFIGPCQPEIRRPLVEERQLQSMFTCIPMECMPLAPCLPNLCEPAILPCFPRTPCWPRTPCRPWVYGQRVVEGPQQRIDEITAKVERITAEIETLRKRIAPK